MSGDCNECGRTPDDGCEGPLDRCQSFQERTIRFDLENSRLAGDPKAERIADFLLGRLDDLRTRHGEVFPEIFPEEDPEEDGGLADAFRRSEAVMVDPEDDEESDPTKRIHALLEQLGGPEQLPSLAQLLTGEDPQSLSPQHLRESKIGRARQLSAEIQAMGMEHEDFATPEMAAALVFLHEISQKWEKEERGSETLLFAWRGVLGHLQDLATKHGMEDDDLVRELSQDLREKIEEEEP